MGNHRPTPPRNQPTTAKPTLVTKPTNIKPTLNLKPTQTPTPTRINGVQPLITSMIKKKIVPTQAANPPIPLKPDAPPKPEGPIKPTKPEPNLTKTGTIPKNKTWKKPDVKNCKKKKIEREKVAGMSDLRKYFKNRVEAPENPLGNNESDFDFILAAPLKPKAEEEQICPPENQTKHEGLCDSTAKGE